MKDINKLVDEYIKSKYELDEMVSIEGLTIFLIEYPDKKLRLNYTQARDAIGEYRGVINTYAVAFLKDKASKAGRNSMQYSILLKEMNAQKELSSDDKLVINIDLNNTSQNSIKNKGGEDG